MKTVEDVKRELRKALGLDPSDKTFDKTKFKVQSDKSKMIGGAAKLIDWKEIRYVMIFFFHHDNSQSSTCKFRLRSEQSMITR